MFTEVFCPRQMENHCNMRRVEIRPMLSSHRDSLSARGSDRRLVEVASRFMDHEKVVSKRRYTHVFLLRVKNVDAHMRRNSRLNKLVICRRMLRSALFALRFVVQPLASEDVPARNFSPR